MRFTKSAGKHGIAREDVLHALRNQVRAYDQDEVTMVIGPARDGAMLEVGVVDDEGDPRVIHAMRARTKFWP